MKLDEVLNWKGPAAKMARLEPLLTPDVMAKHHSEMVNIIASKLANADIDELEAELSGRNLSKEAVEFQLKMISKALAKYGKTEVGTSGNGWRYVECQFQIATDWDLGATEYKYKLTDAWAKVHYERGSWIVHFAGWALKTKKVKTATEALHLMRDYIERMLKKYPLEQAGKPIRGAK